MVGRNVVIALCHDSDEAPCFALVDDSSSDRKVRSDLGIKIETREHKFDWMYISCQGVYLAPAEEVGEVEDRGL